MSNANDPTPFEFPLDLSERVHSAFVQALETLAGGDLCFDAAESTPRDYETRECLKRVAANHMRLNPGINVFCASRRVPYWLLWSWSHFTRACEAVATWPRAERYDHFEGGEPSFRRYFAAWLTAVAVPQLGCTSADLECLHMVFNISPRADALLPVGSSEYRRAAPGAAGAEAPSDAEIGAGTHTIAHFALVAQRLAISATEGITVLEALRKAGLDDNSRHAALVMADAMRKAGMEPRRVGSDRRRVWFAVSQ